MPNPNLSTFLQSAAGCLRLSQELAPCLLQLAFFLHSSGHRWLSFCTEASGPSCQTSPPEVTIETSSGASPSEVARTFGTASCQLSCSCPFFSDALPRVRARVGSFLVMYVVPMGAFGVWRHVMISWCNARLRSDLSTVGRPIVGVLSNDPFLMMRQEVQIHFPWVSVVPDS